MANFEAFFWNISSSINLLLFLKSVCIHSFLSTFSHFSLCNLTSFFIFIFSKKKSNAQIASGISGLELLHETTMSSIEASNKDVSAPSGKNYNFQFHEKKKYLIFNFTRKNVFPFEFSISRKKKLFHFEFWISRKKNYSFSIWRKKNLFIFEFSISRKKNIIQAVSMKDWIAIIPKNWSMKNWNIIWCKGTMANLFHFSSRCI